MPALFDRFSALPGLLITSITCYTLLYLHLSRYRGSENFLIWTREYRTAVTILVQLLSQVLGIIHVHVVCALVRSSFLSSIANKPFRVSSAHFIQTITAPRWTWGLPWISTMTLLMMLGASVVPAPLWAAAIAPLPTRRDAMGVIPIPTFNVSNTTAMWDRDPHEEDYGYQDLDSWFSEQGFFSYTRQISKQALLSSAREASLDVNGTRKHNKLDKTGFLYVGRSYGMGSVAGFANVSGVQNPEWFQYNETGLRADVSCFYNQSIDLHLDQIVHDTFGVWQAYGTRADGSSAGYINYASWTNFDLFAWSCIYDAPNRRLQFQLITGANSTVDPYRFMPLNNLQCNVDLRLHTAHVTINTASMQITVQSREERELPWPGYGDVVGAALSDDLYGFTLSDICHNAGCMLGTSLVFNIDTLRRQNQEDLNTTTLRGTQEFIASMIDNTLINRLLTRLVSNAPEPTLEVPVAIGVPSVQFGDYKFVKIVCILNGVIALAYIAEFVRTCAWKATPPFDIMNDSEVIVAAFEGGRAFEKSFKHTSEPHNYNKRLSAKAMLNLQYDDSQSGKPILFPHSTSLAYTSVPAEERPGVDSFTPSLEHIPLVERRLL